MLLYPRAARQTSAHGVYARLRCFACRTLARFVGKIMLILQALEDVPCAELVDNWGEVIGGCRQGQGRGPACTD